MDLQKQSYKFFIFSMLFVVFILLTGFRFQKIQIDLNSAETMINEKKYTQAEEILNSILDDLKSYNDSNNETEIMVKDIFAPQIYYKLGDIQYKQGIFEEAITHFNDVIKYEKRSEWDVYAIYYSGMSNFYLRKYNDSREYFSRLVKEYKNSREAPEGLYYKGTSYELENNKKRATECFKKFLADYPDHPWVERVNLKIKD